MAERGDRGEKHLGAIRGMTNVWEDAKGSSFSDGFVQTRSQMGWRHFPVEVEDWPGSTLRIAFLSDFHVSPPYTSLPFIEECVTWVNAQAPDLIVLGGDYLAAQRLGWQPVAARPIIAALSKLSAPLGVFAVLGNHDWKDCKLARQTHNRRNSVIEAMGKYPSISLLNNASCHLSFRGCDFYLVGMDSQKPFRFSKLSRHDPDKAFENVPKGQPTILIAHEPDFFPTARHHAILQLSGHTHGGQMNLWGWRPLTPSRYGSRFAYGHFQDGCRHLVVSGGIGFSGFPMRIRQPGEVTFISVSGKKAD